MIDPLELDHMRIVTKARATLAGIPIHDDAAFVCVLHPIEGEPIPISFISLARIEEFVAEMTPYRISFHGVPGEDLSAIQDALADYVATCPTLH